jgi:hypothetical protein
MLRRIRAVMGFSRNEIHRIMPARTATVAREIIASGFQIDCMGLLQFSRDERRGAGKVQRHRSSSNS